MSSPDQAEPEIATTDWVGRAVVRLAVPISYLVWVIQRFSDYEPPDEWRRDAISASSPWELRTALTVRMQFCMVFTIYPVVLAVVSIILAGWMYGLGEDGRLLIVILVVPWLVFFGCLGIVFGFKYELVRVSMGHMEQAFTRAYYSEVPQFSRRLRMAMPNNLDLVVALLLTIAALTAMIVLGSE